MQTVMYLLRHGATEANLAEPYFLQGRRSDLPLAPLGVRQAEATRDFLARCTLDYCYSSPLRRALETAALVAEPHGLTPQPLEALTECDVGRWEGLDWQTIRRLDPEAHQRFQENPAEHGYPDGESLHDVHQRAERALTELLTSHEGKTLLVVSHHVVNRTYLAGLLGLPMRQARQVKLDNCGISVVTRAANVTMVRTLNAVFHLHALPAG